MFHEGLEKQMRLSRVPTHRTTVLSAIAGATVLGLLLTGCAGEPESEAKPKPEATAQTSVDYPVQIVSCGRTTTIEAPVERGVTLNQGATEVALALGVEKQLAGTAYLDDAVPEKWKAAYDSVPVLSAEYPKQEEFLAAEPDFAYASYSSAFEKGTIGTQDELAEDDHIASYVSPFGCDDKEKRPPQTMESVWDEIDGIAAAFGVPDRAAELRAEQQRQLAELAEAKAGDGITVFWYDSGDKTPFVGAGGGGPQLVLEAIGATNIFADLDGSWGEGNWENVVAADPDVIVFADAGWSTAADKQAYLEKDPVLSQLSAVKNKAYVTVPFSESTVGVRLVDGAISVAEQLSGLDLGTE